jgi:hypothetical protein
MPRGVGDRRREAEGQRGRLLKGYLAAVWGVGGVLLLLLTAVFRLTPMALNTFSHPLDWYHWVTLVLFVTFMLYTEGYRGFQLGFSPRVAARAKHLSDYPHTILAVLAPLFCMGLIHATSRRLISSWILVLAIVGFVVAVQFLEQPWRGIVDLGVVLGLTWGVISIVCYTHMAYRSEDFGFPADLPSE